MTPLLIQGAPIVILLVLGYTVGSWRERSHFRSLVEREADYGNIGIANLRTVSEPSSVEQATMITADCVIASDYFKSFAATLRKLLGGDIRSYETLMERARRETILRLLEQARELGATEVWNVRMATSNIASTPGTVSVEVLAYATAIRRAATG